MIVLVLLSISRRSLCITRMTRCRSSRLSRSFISKTFINRFFILDLIFVSRRSNGCLGIKKLGPHLYPPRIENSAIQIYQTGRCRCRIPIALTFCLKVTSCSHHLNILGIFYDIFIMDIEFLLQPINLLIFGFFHTASYKRMSYQD